MKIFYSLYLIENIKYFIHRQVVDKCSSNAANINKAIVDHTLPALCTPITPLPVDMKRSRSQRTPYNASMGGKPQKNSPFPWDFVTLPEAIKR